MEGSYLASPSSMVSAALFFTRPVGSDPYQVLVRVLVQQRDLLPEHVADCVQGLPLQVMQVELEPDCGLWHREQKT
jgi:hypothetical protein